MLSCSTTLKETTPVQTYLSTLQAARIFAVPKSVPSEAPGNLREALDKHAAMDKDTIIITVLVMQPQWKDVQNANTRLKDDHLS